VLFASTTNFGLALPFQHSHRRKTAIKYGLNAYNSSKTSLNYLIEEFREKIQESEFNNKNILFIQPILNRGISDREKTPIKSPILIRYLINKDLYNELRENKKYIKLVNHSAEKEKISYHIKYNQIKDSYLLEAMLPSSFFKKSKEFPPFLLIKGAEKEKIPNKSNNLMATPEILKNDSINLQFNSEGFVDSFKYNGKEYACPRFLESAVSYGPFGKQTRYFPEIREIIVLDDGKDGFSASLKLKSEFEIIPGKNIISEKILTLLDGLPYLFIDVKMELPEIKGEATSEDGVEFVKETFNENWKEIMPCEIKPNIFSNSESKYLRIWKKNFLGVVDYFDLNMKLVDSENADIDCLVSNISDGWMALSNQEKGLMIGFNSLNAANFAFSPIKIRDKGFKDCNRKNQQIRVNPFGTYFGKSLHYWTAGSGHAQKLLPKMMLQKKSTAATFSGKTFSFELILSPYLGDIPPEKHQSFLDHYSLPPFLIISTKNSTLFYNSMELNKIAKSLIKEFDVSDIMEKSYIDWVRTLNKDFDPTQSQELPQASMKLGLRTILTLLIDGIKGR
jgi:hypothetical protein